MTIKKTNRNKVIENSEKQINETLMKEVSILQNLVILLLSKAGGSLHVEKPFVKTFLEQSGLYTYEVKNNDDGSININLVEI